MYFHTKSIYLFRIHVIKHTGVTIKQQLAVNHIFMHSSYDKSNLYSSEEIKDVQSVLLSRYISRAPVPDRALSPQQFPYPNNRE